MAIKIGMFNHKGGVSKTTTTYNIGWMLTNLKKKVLLVDTDSQCNLSNIIIGDDLEQFYQEHPDQNIKSYLSAAFEAKPSLIEPAECVVVKDNKNLLLLPGSFELSEYDVSLGVSFTVSSALGTLKNLPGSFNYLIDKTAEKYNVDFVIIDMNPSLSAINQVLLESCNYFIVPATPDYFSKMAITSLSKILPKWERRALTARTAFADSIYSFPLTTPKFLGTIVQKFNIRKGKPTKATSDVIGEIRTTVETILVPALKEVSMIDENNKGDHCLGEIPDFNTLNSIFHQEGIPVFQLSDGQLGQVGTITGVVLEQYKETRKALYQSFEAITNKIIGLINE